MFTYTVYHMFMSLYVSIYIYIYTQIVLQSSCFGMFCGVACAEDGSVVYYIMMEDIKVVFRRERGRQTSKESSSVAFLFIRIPLSN